MTLDAFRPSGLAVMRAGALALVLGLAACTAVPDLGKFGVGVSKSALQFSRGRLDRMWVTAPSALVMVQRGTKDGGEQIIGLNNVTTLEGDNFMWLGAHRNRSGNRIDLKGLVEKVGGVPTPFTSLDNRNLRSSTDSMGPYFWQEYRSGTETNCVIAFRQLGGGIRPLQAFLRNCVHGTIEEALIPIRDNQIGLSTLAGAPATGGGIRPISPLAGPRL